MLNDPSPTEAWEFCLMLKAGLSDHEAIRYFMSVDDVDDPAKIRLNALRWSRADTTQRAQLRMLGKRWQEMSLEEMIQLALDRHYAQLAYLLFTRNYADLGAGDKAKADTARETLQAKLAGSAGQLNPLDRFVSDLLAKRVGRDPGQGGSLTHPPKSAIN